MHVDANDREVLRRLAAEQAEIAALPVHARTAEQWDRCNRLGRGKPMVWINEIPWNEMDVDGELTLQCRDEFARSIEQELRRTLYQWRHMPGDMVVEPVLYCQLVIEDTGFGMDADIDVARTDPTSDVISRHYHEQFQKIEDVEKLQFPRITHHVEQSQRNFEWMREVFGGVIGVVQRGLPGRWFSPWDLLITWWGVERAMTDLVLQPELVHAAMDRLTAAFLHRLDQFEQQNLLALNNANIRVGSGGPGYCGELPGPNFDPAAVRAKDLWGCATAQIFSGVSPAMHEEFALRYEKRWLARFGLNYYGCCEPLDLKVDILRSIPNLRKISMSPWVNVERGAAALGGDYVFSFKPSPADLAWDRWEPDRVRRELRATLEKTRRCVVEVIMKDISTVRREPRRLWEWARIAAEETERLAGGTGF